MGLCLFVFCSVVVFYKFLFERSVFFCFFVCLNVVDLWLHFWHTVKPHVGEMFTLAHGHFDQVGTPPTLAKIKVMRRYDPTWANEKGLTSSKNVSKSSTRKGLK